VGVLNVDDITDLSVAKQVAQLALAENAHLHKRIAALAEEISALRGDKAPEQLALELSWLEQRIAGLQRQLFAASSERRPRPAADADEATSKQEREPGVGPRVQRKLPRLRVEHRMPESQRLCPCCGKPMVEWSGQAEETEEVDVVERRFVLKKHVRQKYRCKCGSAPKTAPGPMRMPGGGRYSLDFAIEVADAKWHQHNPLERQVRCMRTEGLDVTASTLWEQSERDCQEFRVRVERLLKEGHDHGNEGRDPEDRQATTRPQEGA
jgi:transposase